MRGERVSGLGGGGYQGFQGPAGGDLEACPPCAYLYMVSQQQRPQQQALPFHQPLRRLTSVCCLLSPRCRSECCCLLLTADGLMLVADVGVDEWVMVGCC